MKVQWAVPIIASILILGTLGLTPNVYAVQGTITDVSPPGNHGKITEDDCNDSTCEHPFQR